MSDLIETLELMCEQDEIQEVPRSFLVDLRDEIERLTAEVETERWHARNETEAHKMTLNREELLQEALTRLLDFAEQELTRDVDCPDECLKCACALAATEQGGNDDNQTRN